MTGSEIDKIQKRILSEAFKACSEESPSEGWVSIPVAGSGSKYKAAREALEEIDYIEVDAEYPVFDKLTVRLTKKGKLFCDVAFK